MGGLEQEARRVSVMPCGNAASPWCPADARCCLGGTQVRAWCSDGLCSWGELGLL